MGKINIHSSTIIELVSLFLNSFFIIFIYRHLHPVLLL